MWQNEKQNVHEIKNNDRPLSNKERGYSMKKKLFCILLASVMLFGVACDKKSSSAAETTTVETTTKKTRPVVSSTTTEPTTSADFRDSFDGLAGDFIDMCRKNDYDIALQEYQFTFLDGVDEPVRALNASGENGNITFQCIVFENPSTAVGWMNAMVELADEITKKEEGSTPTGCKYLGIWSDTQDLDSMSLYFVMGNTFVSMSAPNDYPECHRTVEQNYKDLTGKELKVSTI